MKLLTNYEIFTETYCKIFLSWAAFGKLLRITDDFGNDFWSFKLLLETQTSFRRVSGLQELVIFFTEGINYFLLALV